MRVWYILVAVVASIPVGVMLWVSSSANYYYGAELGTAEPIVFTLFGWVTWETTTSVMLAHASLASDMLKAVVCLMLLAVIRARLWTPALALGLIAVFCFAWSLQSAVGFSSMNFNTSADQRTQKSVSWEVLQGEIARIEKEIGWIPEHRPAETVQSAIEAKENHLIWSRTEACANATIPESIRFCNDHGQLEQELQNAQRHDELSARLATLREEVRTTEAVSQPDTQAAMVASVFGLQMSHALVQKVITGRSLGFAALVEIVSALGFFAIWSPVITGYKRREKAAAPTEDVAESSATPVYGSVDRYFRENTQAEQGARHTAAEMYADYCEVCRERGEMAVAITTFGSKAADFVSRGKEDGRVVYYGRAIPGAGGVRTRAA